MLETDDTPTKPESNVKAVLDRIQKIAVSVITLTAEVAVVAFVGASIGSYMSAKAIVADCQHVQIAKVGDTYVRCTIVEPVKDSATQPPR